MNLLRVFVAEASRIYETRAGRAIEDALFVDQPYVAWQLLAPEMAHLAQEQLRTINLNVKHRLLSTHMVYQGSLSASPVRVAEVFRPAIIENASGLIVVHNHPSGDPTPSPDDIKVTRQLVDAGRLLDVTVHDHLIIGGSGFVSLRERGLGF